MGKTSKSSNTNNYPKSSSSTFSVNGNPLVTTTTNGTSFSSNYNFSDAENATNEYVQNAILKGLSSVNTFLPETIENINSEIDSYTKRGVNTINETYTPMIQDLEESVASRFGNLDNSIFLDNLSGLESKRSDAISNLALDVESKRSELIDDELERQYNYLNLLTDYKDQTYKNVLASMELGKSALSSNSKYNSDLYSYLTDDDDSFKFSGSSLTKLYSYLSGLGGSSL